MTETPPDAGASGLDPLQTARGIIVMHLLLDADAWVHRRTETITFVDDKTVNQRVTVDFTIPQQVRGYLDITADLLPLVPLSLLRKRVLRHFDLRDADRSAVPLLDTIESTQLAEGALRARSTELIGWEPSELVVRDLKTIAAESGDALRSAFEAMMSEQGKAPQRSLDPPGMTPGTSRPDIQAADAVPLEVRARFERNKLVNDAEFFRMLVALAQSFIVAAACDPNPGSRQLIKYSYESHFDSEDPGAARWLATRLGWRAPEFRVRTPGAKQARSYHVEVVAPEDLEVVRADLCPSSEQSPVASESGGLGRAHVHPSVPLGPSTRPVTRVFLRMRRSGFLPAALVTCALSVLLLGAARFRLVQLESQVGPASTLLLLVPALMAAYLVHPREHAIATSILVGVRVMLLLCGAAMVAAAGLLLARLDLVRLRFAWDILVFLSAAALLVVLLSALLPMKGERTVGGR
jgi:hypothetical protein